MVKTAAAGVRIGNPKAYVVFGGMAGVDKSFLDRCYQYGVKDYFDVMAAHPYQWGKKFNDEWFFVKLERLHSLMKSWDNLNKPVWLNEIGWSTGNEKISENDQARLLVQCYVSALSRLDLGIERIFWYCAKDWGGPSYGVYAPDGHKKPAWYAYQTMVQSLKGLKCIGQIKVDVPVRSYVFGDEQGNKAIIVVWSAELESYDVVLPLKKEPRQAWNMLGKKLSLTNLEEEKLRLQVSPEPIYIETTPKALTDFESVKPLEVSLPNPGRRVPAWISVYPQPGCSLPWFWRDKSTQLRGRLFNATNRNIEGEVVAKLLESKAEKAISKTSVQLAANADTDTDFTLSIHCPADAPSEAILKVSAHMGELNLPGLTIDALIADGPTVNFLANTHLERSWYLEPGAKSGCSESVRFGNQWTYKLSVPFECNAIVRMDVGAHRSQRWSVSWSQDKKEWQSLMSGESSRGWRRKEIEALKPGALYLKCEGNNQQVGEVRVTFVPQR